MVEDPKAATTIDIKKYTKYLSAAVGTLIFGNPIELVKSRIQTSPEHMAKGTIDHPYLSVWETFGRVVKEEQVRGLFKGVGYFIVRTIPPNIGIFTIKELIHTYLTDYVKTGKNKTIKSTVLNHYLLVNGFVGGIAGFIIQICIYPF